MAEDIFKFWMPVGIVKGKSNNNKSDKDSMKMGGIASTSEIDTDGEELIPSGFDTSYLNSYGFINWHHGVKKSPNAIIGEPTTSKITNKGLYIECELYDKPLAKEVFELAELLEKQSKNRRLGFSIEGKVLERDPINKNKITKASITGVAITHMPKNPATFAEIIKGEVINNDFYFEEVEENDANGGKNYLVDLTKPNGDRLLVDSEGRVKIIQATEKSLNTNNGSPLMPESIDKETKILTKSEIFEEINSRFSDIGVQEFKQLYQLINNISTMGSITQEDIQKAQELLEKASASNRTKPAEGQEKNTDIFKEMSVGDNYFKEMKKGEFRKMRYKGEEEEDEYVDDNSYEKTQKGYKMKEKGFYAKNEEGEEVEKSLNILLERFDAKTDEIQKGLSDKIEEQSDKTSELFKAVGIILTNFNEQIESLKEDINQISNQPVGVRKSIDANNFQERNFGVETDKIKKALSEGKLFSLKSHKQQLKAKLNELAFNGDDIIDESFAKGLTHLETNGSLPADVINKLKLRDITIVA